MFPVSIEEIEPRAACLSENASVYLYLSSSSCTLEYVSILYNQKLCHSQAPVSWCHETVIIIVVSSRFSGCCPLHILGHRRIYQIDSLSFNKSDPPGSLLRAPEAVI